MTRLSKSRDWVEKKNHTHIKQQKKTNETSKVMFTMDSYNLEKLREDFRTIIKEESYSTIII